MKLTDDPDITVKLPINGRVYAIRMPVEALVSFSESGNFQDIPLGPLLEVSARFKSHIAWGLARVMQSTFDNLPK